MICSNCGTSFNGAFCPRCGAAASGTSSTLKGGLSSAPMLSDSGSASFTSDSYNPKSASSGSAGFGGGYSYSSGPAGSGAGYGYAGTAGTPSPTTVYINNSGSDIPEEYKPITMWGYFGYEILFSIPCIGFILLCVFSFGGTRNVNLKNFARSYFCFIIIVAVLVFAFVAITGGLSALFAFGASNTAYRL